jgi:hypothetical protein
MAKEKAIYEPGELDRVRERLGAVDPQEAKRMVELLGGEVGVERSAASPAPVKRTVVDTAVGESRRPRHTPPAARSGEKGEAGKPPKKPEDDLPVSVSYRERVKMDKYAGLPEFDIKSPLQVFRSIVSVFNPGPDYVSTVFVTRRMSEYYRKIELLVTSTRSLLPRNNLRRNEQLRRTSPFFYSILDTIRYWNIDTLSGELSRLQAHPRNVTITDFADILRMIYKPLFVLELMDTEIHIKEAYKLLYKIVFVENPAEAKNKQQAVIRSALAAYITIRRDIRYLLYPVLMKLLSDRWLPYERFFTDRRNRFLAFLRVEETDRISPADALAEADPARHQPDERAEDAPADEEAAGKKPQGAEKKAVDRGLQTLETLFPKAGWDRLASFPDLYPYFAETFSLQSGQVLIAPADPMQQVVILMHIIAELFFALRYVSFGTIRGPDGAPEEIGGAMNDIINNWDSYIDMSLTKEYLPRLSEYCRILETSSESRTSPYSRRILDELHRIKRMYFLPYYKFQSSFPSSFQRKNIRPLYPEVRSLRRYLTAVAAGIEQGNKNGGPEKKAPCDGIDNPWEPYIFQVPNPLSKRLDRFLGPQKRNNASLLFFTLATATVLDYLMNNENSWAYDRSGPLFRSVNDQGITPLTGVEARINVDAIFKQAMNQREQRRQAAKG